MWLKLQLGSPVAPLYWCFPTSVADVAAKLKPSYSCYSKDRNQHNITKHKKTKKILTSNDDTWRLHDDTCFSDSLPLLASFHSESVTHGPWPRRARYVPQGFAPAEGATATWAETSARAVPVAACLLSFDAFHSKALPVYTRLHLRHWRWKVIDLSRKSRQCMQCWRYPLPAPLISCILHHSICMYLCMNGLSTKSCRPANTLRNHPAETKAIGLRIVGLNLILVRLINRTQE